MEENTSKNVEGIGEPNVNPDPLDEVHRPGYRHLTQLIEHIAAHDADRTWAAMPLDDKNLSLGFRDISFGQFANAVKHCAHWLADKLPKSKQPFETVAYTGKKDVRYPIIAMALARLERKLLMASPSTTVAAQAHLAGVLDVRCFLHSEGYGGTVEQVATQSGCEASILKVPEVEWFLREERAAEYSWKRSWEEARHMPWLVLHTGGTTGMPKPIIYTHQMMVSFDATELMADAKTDSFIQHVSGIRWYSPFPVLHVLGMYMTLQVTLVRGGIAVFGPPDDLSPQAVLDTIRYGRCQAMMSTPMDYELLVRDELGLETLRKLRYCYFGGAPLAPAVAEKLMGYTRVCPAMGSTEAGMYFVQPLDQEDWEWYKFRESNGIEFEAQGEGLHELVFVRRGELARWQQIFDMYPELDVFRTGDLFTEHPRKRGLWKPVGRTDDVVIFSHGKKLNASEREAALSACPDVAGVVVGGTGKERPYALVEWSHPAMTDAAKMERLWPWVERANRTCADFMRISREHVVFAVPAKPLLRNVKRSPVRKACEVLYADEIERLYAEEDIEQACVK
ncbi:AMP-binding enzyme [Polyplosphaeria fusca]|uniref:AMP-binding enzyme n=1 Tax=Polyplosphaeria fusca TaxID=682080 RepID=A0A9P4V2U7_9PLEO|nr:AMP-binding enzyme [Polyplosphaeria fusca]